MERTTLSFDGHGINDCDEYGSRIATLTSNYKQSQFGPLFAAAPDLLVLAHNVTFLANSDLGKSEAGKLIIDLARAAIAKAKGE